MMHVMRACAPQRGTSTGISTSVQPSCMPGGGGGEGARLFLVLPEPTLAAWAPCARMYHRDPRRPPEAAAHAAVAYATCPCPYRERRRQHLSCRPVASWRAWDGRGSAWALAPYRHVLHVHARSLLVSERAQRGNGKRMLERMGTVAGTTASR